MVENCYINISKEECFCIYEPIEDRMLKLYFSFYPERIVFVKNRDEKIIGIISLLEFEKGMSDGKYHINKDFKRIIFHGTYLEEVKKFFNQTKYKCIPVLDEDGTLIECFCRKKQDTLSSKDKWLNIKNPHLAKLVEMKGFKKIKICMTDSLSERVYSYFKYYEFYFDTVEQIPWYNIEKAKRDEVLIINKLLKLYLDLTTSVYLLHTLHVELEYNLLINRCRENGVKLYVFNIPTNANVWNLTEEEKKRINFSKDEIYWLKNKEQYFELLSEVLDIREGREDFIESCLNLPPIIRKDQLYYMRDFSGKYVNVIQGNRVTKGVPKQVKNHIYLSGNSFVFGNLVDDAHTMASLLQQWINNSSDFQNYEVVNEGVRGLLIYESLKRLNHDFFKSGDIVVLFVRKEQLEWLRVEDLFDNIKVYHLENVFNGLDRSIVDTYFINLLTHPNAFGYQLCVDYLIDVLGKDYDDSWSRCDTMEDIPVYEQEYDFGDISGLKEYLEDLKKICVSGENNGAIVMNCNPLTYGHKYLIEYAAKLVDHLYIFVVQEDKSVFPFEERFEMVCACAEEYSNITVLPSGQYIISAFTFPEYFTKQMANPDTVIDASDDVTIFGKYIAPVLNIKVRFAGEEPTDIVTAQYNEFMKKILPAYGIRFVEIPRYEKEGIEVISATKVRKALEDNDWDRVKWLVPETTYHILKNSKNSLKGM